MPPDLPVQYQLWEAETLAVILGPSSPYLPDSLDDRGIPWEDHSGVLHLLIEAFGPDTLTPVSPSLIVAQGGMIGSTFEQGTACTIPITNVSELAYSLPDGAYLLMQVPDSEDSRGREMEVLAAQAAPTGRDTMGLFVTNALAYQRAGFSGRGVKLAVIDGGFNGLAALRASGDAPPADSTTVFDLVGTGIAAGSAHGAACLEILYDFAPDARYYLFRIRSDMDAAHAVGIAQAQGVDIISMSQSWYNTGWKDGTAPISRAADQFANTGKIMFCSSGNQAQEHYEALFTDANANRWHDLPNGTEEIAIVLRPQIAGTPDPTFYLQWDRDPTNAEGRPDLDMFLYRWEPTTARFHLLRQAATRNLEFPATGLEVAMYEQLTWTNPGAADSTYYLGIWRRKGPAVNFEVTSRAQGGVWSTVRDSIGSSGQPSSALHKRVVPVGAIDYRCYGPVLAGCTAAVPAIPREVFSCLGPTNGGLGTPTLAGPDRLTTQTKGVDAFAGTSCSTPAVAGVAAVLKSAKLALPHATVLAQMNIWALRFRDWPPAGKDTYYGYGAVLLPEVKVDVNPRFYNRIVLNPAAATTIEVALLGTTTMDVDSVEHATVKLKGAAEYPQSAAVSPEDVNGDGRKDAVYKFNIPAAAPRGTQKFILYGDFKNNGLVWGGSETVLLLNLGALGVGPPGVDFGISSISPNPGPGAAHVACRLMPGAPARLEVFDVAGRRVFARNLGATAGGPAEVVVQLSRSQPAGLYTVRLSQRGRAQSARWAIVR